MGYRILLDKDLQVKHLKEWRLKSLLRTDIFSRAIPWTRLILESQGMINDLNLQKSQKISAALLGLAILAITVSIFNYKLTYLALFLLFTIFLINHKLFGYFYEFHKFGRDTGDFYSLRIFADWIADWSADHDQTF